MTTPTPGAGSPGSGVAGGVLAAVGALALIATVLALVLAFGPAGRDDAGAGAERRRWNGGFTPAPPTVNTQGYAEPVQGRVTSRFGPRPNPFGEGVVPSGVSEEALTRHDGVDLGGVPEGTPFRSVSAGTVLIVDGGGEEAGNLILVDAGDGHTWRYLHAATGTSAVDEGDVVEPGDVLAGVGATGLATAPHLHLELRVQGETVDPVPYLADRGVVLGEDA